MPKGIADRKNLVLGVINGATFEVFGAFLNMATTIPIFLYRLGATSGLVGFVSGIMAGGWLFPQLFLANKIESFPLKRKAYAQGAVARMAALGLVVGAAFLLAKDNSSAALWVTVVGLCLFSIIAGYSTLAFFQMVGKVIPSEKRASFFAYRLFFGGIGAFAAGAVVKWILAEGRYVFPINYGIVFTIAFCFAAIAHTAFSIIEESPDEPLHRSAGILNYIGETFHEVRKDRNFMKFLLVYICSGATSIATPFLAKYAIEVFDLPESTVGLFISAQMVGGIVSNLFWGRLGDRKGPRIVITITTAVSSLVPLLAVILGQWGELVFGRSTAASMFSLVYILIGLSLGGIYIGTSGYILSAIPQDKKSAFIGFANTLSSLVILFPLVGGILIDNYSYIHAFGFCFAAQAVGSVFSLWLKAPGENDENIMETF